MADEASETRQVQEMTSLSDQARDLNALRDVWRMRGHLQIDLADFHGCDPDTTLWKDLQLSVRRLT
jgi:hypothetical protein